MVMVDYVENGGKSRGSAPFIQIKAKLPYGGLPDISKYTLDDGSRGNMAGSYLQKVNVNLIGVKFARFQKMTIFLKMFGEFTEKRQYF